jgi:hypothetical protein
VQEQLVEPVVAADGWTYSREAIELWFRYGFETSPVTKDFLPSKKIMVNRAFQFLLEEASLHPHLWKGRTDS